MADFTVTLSRAVTTTSSSPPVAQWRFSGDDVVVRFSTELPGGFGRCQIGGLRETAHGERIPAYLPQTDAELRPFDHLVVAVGASVVWEGRVTEPLFDAWGEPVGLTADGYWSMFNDGYYAGAGSGLVTSGAILRDLVDQLAPALHIGSSAQFIDPATPTEASELDGLRGGAIWDHLARVGDPFGRVVDPMVWHERTVWLLSRGEPARPDYALNLGGDLELSTDWNELYGRVAVRYTHPIDGEAETAFAEDPGFLERYGFQRSFIIEGGTLTAAVAETVRDTFLAQHRRPAYAISYVTERGLPRPDGAVIPPHLVRAGQWVQLADLGNFIIIRAEFDSDSSQLTLQLNREAHDWEQQLHTMQHVVAAINAKLNPQTGGRS